jgi:hypothetical protein
LRGEGGRPARVVFRTRPALYGSTLRGVLSHSSLRLGGDPSAAEGTVTVTPGAVTFTGQTVNIDGSVSVPVTAGALTFTGQAVALTNTVAVTPGAVTFAGQTVQMTGLTAIGVTPGTVTFSGAARAITVTELVETASTANATSYATASYTPTANRGLLAWVAAYATLDPAPTFTGNGLTWTLEAIRTLGAPAHSICLFSALSGSSPSTGAGTFDCAADPATGAVIHVVEIDGCDLTDFTTQTAVNGGTSGVTPSATFAGSTASNAAVVAYLANTTNPAGVTEPSGFTELMDTGFDTPASGGQMSYAASPGAITTVTWGSNSASIWATHIVEVKAGQPIILRQIQALTPGTLTFTGQTVNVGTVTTAQVSTPGALTLTGQTVLLRQTQALGAGAVTFAGQSVGIMRTVPVTAGALTLAGQAVALRQLQIISAGAVVFAGQSVTPMEGGFDTADEWRLGGLSGKWYVGAAEGKWLVGAAGRKWHVEP